MRKQFYSEKNSVLSVDSVKVDTKNKWKSNSKHNFVWNLVNRESLRKWSNCEKIGVKAITQWFEWLDFLAAMRSRYNIETNDKDVYDVMVMIESEKWRNGVSGVQLSIVQFVKN